MEAGTKELVSRADLAEAKRGFDRLLRRKRISHRWRQAHAEDLLAKALQEYAVWLKDHGPAGDAAAWLITCAWRRSMDLFDYESVREPTTSIDADVIGEIADSATPTPESAVVNAVMSQDNGEKLRWAMGFLEEKDKRLLGLIYFDELNIKEAGRRLGWLAPRTERHHKAALARLRNLLDGKVEVPALEVGIVAWTSAGIARSRVDLSGLLEPFRESGIAASEAVRRLLPYSEPANATMLGGGGRVAGACGAAVLLCVAGAAAGPDPGGLLTGDREKAAPMIRSAPRAVVSDSLKESPAEATPTPSHSSPANGDRSTFTQKTQAKQSRPRAQSGRPAKRDSPPAASATRSDDEEVIDEYGLPGEGDPAPAPSAGVVSGDSIGGDSSSASPSPSTARPSTPTLPPSGESTGDEFGL